jgi:hypothetical protein
VFKSFDHEVLYTTKVDSYEYVERIYIDGDQEICTHEEVREDWRKLHNEEVHNFCSSSNVFGACSKQGIRSVYRLVVAISEGKGHLEDRGVDG